MGIVDILFVLSQKENRHTQKPPVFLYPGLYFLITYKNLLFYNVPRNAKLMFGTLISCKGIKIWLYVDKRVTLHFRVELNCLWDDTI